MNDAGSITDFIVSMAGIKNEYIIQNYRRDVNKFSDLNSIKQCKLIIEQPI